MKKALRIILGAFIVFSVTTLIVWLVSPEISITSLSLTKIVFIIGVFILVFFIFAMVEGYIRLTISKDKAPIIVKQVTAISKTMNNNRYGSSYYIAFVFFDGQRKNIRMNIDQYNTICEKEEGLLTYKEYGRYIWFVSFKATP